MKLKIVALWVSLCCFAINDVSARLVIVGQHSSSSANYSGMNGKYKYSSAEFIVGAHEINDTGHIRSIAFYKCAGDTGALIDSVHIYLKVSDTGIGKTVSLDGYSEVFAGVLPNSISKGWLSLPLPVPFAYSGGNITVLIVRKNGSLIAKGYPDFAVSFSARKEYQAAYFLSDTNPWTGSPARSAQNLYTQYRPYLSFDIE